MLADFWFCFIFFCFSGFLSYSQADRATSHTSGPQFCRVISKAGEGLQGHRPTPVYFLLQNEDVLQLHYNLCQHQSQKHLAGWIVFAS